MKIIVVAKKAADKKTHLMFKLSDKKAIKEVKSLISSLKCQKAVSNILAKGKFIKELAEEDVQHEASDLIISGSNAYWSLL